MGLNKKHHQSQFQEPIDWKYLHFFKGQTIQAEISGHIPTTHMAQNVVLLYGSCLTCHHQGLWFGTNGGLGTCQLRYFGGASKVALGKMWKSLGVVSEWENPATKSSKCPFGLMIYDDSPIFMVILHGYVKFTDGQWVVTILEPFFRKPPVGWYLGIFNLRLNLRTKTHQHMGFMNSNPWWYDHRKTGNCWAGAVCP